MDYTVSATCKGGREGRSILDGNGLALAMGLPKEMGGAGQGHNPEQLFALGYASCFNSAVLALAKKHNVDASTARVTCAVILEAKDGKFGLKVALTLGIPGVDKQKIETLLQDAHGLCPYSQAIKGNIPITLAVA